jgi:hypothetical protein
MQIQVHLNFIRHVLHGRHNTKNSCSTYSMIITNSVVRNVNLLYRWGDWVWRVKRFAYNYTDYGWFKHRASDSKPQTPLFLSTVQAILKGIGAHILVLLLTNFSQVTWLGASVSSSVKWDFIVCDPIKFLRRLNDAWRAVIVPDT